MLDQRFSRRFCCGRRCLNRQKGNLDLQIVHAAGEFSDPIMCADGADNQPNSQGDWNSKNYQDNENNNWFHKFRLSANDVAWMSAICTLPPVADKLQMRARNLFDFICWQLAGKCGGGLN